MGAKVMAFWKLRRKRVVAEIGAEGFDEGLRSRVVAKVRAARAEAVAHRLPGPRAALAEGVDVDEIVQIDRAIGGDEAAVDLVFGLIETGLQGEADGGALLGFAVAEAEHQPADRRLARLHVLRQIRVAWIAHHAEAVVAQAALGLFAGAGVEAEIVAVAAEQHGLHRVQQRGFARGVGADHRDVALDGDLQRVDQIPVDEDDPFEALHCSVSALSSSANSADTSADSSTASSTCSLFCT